MLRSQFERRSLLFTGALALLLSFGGCDDDDDDDGNRGSSVVNVVSVPATFEVENVNRSRVPCATDGQTYRIRGHLVGPEAAIDDARAVTVYMHGIGWGEYYWHFQAVPGYDTATELAKLGHVSLVFDQLGYGASDRPPGMQSCYGGEADIVSQMIDDLRAGSYELDGRGSPSFDRVALASHSVAGLMSEPAAYSFKNIDALVVTAWADQGFSLALIAEAVGVNVFCFQGGERSDGTEGPNGYHFTPLQTSQFGALNFANADPDVIEAATAMRNRGPCGEPLSAIPTIVFDDLQLLLREITVPVLLVYGRQDEFFLQPLAGSFQASLYGGSGDVSTVFIDDAGQALALERSAPEFRAALSSWLDDRGF